MFGYNDVSSPRAMANRAHARMRAPFPTAHTLCRRFSASFVLAIWRGKCTDDPDSVGLNREADPGSQRTTMRKNSKNNKKPKSTLESNTQPAAINGQPKVGKKIGKNEYEAGIFKLRVELVKLQD